MKDETRRQLLGAAGLIWLVLVISLYYVSHKPFQNSFAARLAVIIWQIVVVGGIVSLGGALGSLLIPAREERPLSALILQAAFGLGALSIAWLLVGATAGFPGWLLAAALALPLAALRRRVVRWWRGWRALESLWHGAEGVSRALALGAGLALLISLLTALAPPLKFDALVYHLTLPQDYLTDGRLSYSPDLIYWGMPQLVELLYAWAMGLAGLQAAALLGWALGGLALIGILSTAEKELGVEAGWVAVAVLLAGFSLADSLGWAYADWAAILYGWAVLDLLARWRKERKPRQLILAGAAAGLGLGVKYTAGVLLLIGAGVILLDRSKPPGQRLLDAGRFGLPAVLVSCPWWIKNALATSNPFYPLLFPARAMTAVRLSGFQSQPPWGGWQDSLFLPWRATLAGLEGAPGFSASIGPLLLGLGAFFWLYRKQGTTEAGQLIRLATWFAVLGLGVWAVASRTSGLLIQTRLYLAVFPAFAILASAGFSGLNAVRWPGVRLGRVVGILVVLVLGLNVIQLLSRTVSRGVAPFLLGSRQEGQFLADNLGWYAPAMQAVANLPGGSKTLLLWEPRSYYCRPKCMPDEILDRWRSDTARFPENADLLASWIAEGFTHMLFYRPGAEFYREQEGPVDAAAWARLDRLLEGLPPPTNYGNVYELYPLAP